MGKIIPFFIIQLKIYAKYTTLNNVIQDETDRSYAICKNEDNKVDDDIVGNKKLVIFVFLAILLPILFIMLSITVVRSFNTKINYVLARRSGHHNLTGLALAGMMLTCYVLLCDIAAMINNEMSQDINTVILIFLILNSGISLIHLGSILIYICCKHINEYRCLPANENGSVEQVTVNNCEKWCECKKCCDCCVKFCITDCLPCCLFLSFYAVSGDKKQDKIWNEIGISTRAAWIVTLSLAAPLFSVSSHIIFILVAWFTYPTKASSVAILGIVVSLYFFFMLKQCYTVNKGIGDKKYCCNCCSTFCCSTFCLPFYPVCQIFSVIKAIIYKCKPCQCLSSCQCCSHSKTYSSIQSGKRQRITEASSMTSNYGSMPPSNQSGSAGVGSPVGASGGREPAQEANTESNSKDYFDTKAFCVTLSWGLILAIPVIFTICVFHELPIVTISLISELVGTVEIFFIIFSGLITYKILTFKEPDINRFLTKLRDAFIRKSESKHEISPDIENKANFDEVEAAGSLVGELAEVVIHNLPKIDIPHCAVVVVPEGRAQRLHLSPFKYTANDEASS